MKSPPHQLLKTDIKDIFDYLKETKLMVSQFTTFEDFEAIDPVS